DNLLIGDDVVNTGFTKQRSKSIVYFLTRNKGVRRWFPSGTCPLKSASAMRRLLSKILTERAMFHYHNLLTKACIGQLVA
ncbi:MAG: hypothetical protein ACE5OW_05855, partial [Candidatus Bathyarchaeia archaeon]